MSLIFVDDIVGLRVGLLNFFLFSNVIILSNMIICNQSILILHNLENNYIFYVSSNQIVAVLRQL